MVMIAADTVRSVAWFPSLCQVNLLKVHQKDYMKWLEGEISTRSAGRRQYKQHPMTWL